MRVVLGVALVGLVVCAGCGPPKPTREEAIAAIKRLGGKVEVDENNDVVDVSLGGTKITDVGLAHLEGLTKLKSLYLSKTEVTGAGLVHLKGLTGLEKLSLFLTKVTDAGLVHLKGLNKLETLFLSDTKVTDAGLEHLKGLTKLQELALGKTKVTAAGIKQLQQALPNCKIDHWPPWLLIARGIA